MFKLGNASKRKLVGVHPALAFCVTEAIKRTTQDFTVFEGVRTLKKQKEYVKRGVSWTLKSRHLSGNAVDLVVWKNGRPTWDGCESEYKAIEVAMKEVIAEYDLPINWGFDLWGKDTPHWQMKKNSYDIRRFMSEKRIQGIING